MKFTNMELLKECALHTGKAGFSVQTMRSILLKRFNINSLRYNHVAKDYMKQTVLVMKMEDLIKFDDDTGFITMNLDNIQIIDMLEEVNKELKPCSEKP
jgi:hypothetical protein